MGRLPGAQISSASSHYGERSKVGGYSEPRGATCGFASSDNRAYVTGGGDSHRRHRVLSSASHQGLCRRTAWRSWGTPTWLMRLGRVSRASALHAAGIIPAALMGRDVADRKELSVQAGQEQGTWHVPGWAWGGRRRDSSLPLLPPLPGPQRAEVRILGENALKHQP